MRAAASGQSAKPRLAAQTLGSTSRGVAQIAADVGYESEAAFNRAFKRALGEPPAAYRRRRRPRTIPRARHSGPTAHA
jgi:transcriptional regulator GlxA family with amidase domain